MAINETPSRVKRRSQQVLISAKPFPKSARSENAFPAWNGFEQPFHSDIFGRRPILHG
jgi:hypothetical protein